jgi:hypothetical protein
VLELGAPFGLSAGGSFTFGPADIHRVSHSGTQPAATLHAYSPPLWRMTPTRCCPPASCGDGRSPTRRSCARSGHKEGPAHLKLPPGRGRRAKARKGEQARTL